MKTKHSYQPTKDNINYLEFVNKAVSEFEDGTVGLGRCLAHYCESLEIDLSIGDEVFEWYINMETKPIAIRNKSR